MHTDNPIQDTILAMRFSNKSDFRFLSTILSECNIVPNTESNFLIGMKIKDEQYNLHINLFNFHTYPLKKRMELLEHECKHILIHVQQQKKS